MEREQVRHAIVRREADPDFHDHESRITELEDKIRFQSFLMEHMAKEMDLMVEVLMTMDCKFEAVFEEIDSLQRRAGMSRVRRIRLRRLEGSP